LQTNIKSIVKIKACLYLFEPFHCCIDFKKAPAEEKSNLFTSLLRGYQEEVDNLTKRAKFGENAFLNIYQKLYEAPDPYPVVASVAVSTITFDDDPVLLELLKHAMISE